MAVGSEGTPLPDSLAFLATQTKVASLSISLARKFACGEEALWRGRLGELERERACVAVRVGGGLNAAGQICETRGPFFGMPPSIDVQGPKLALYDISLSYSFVFFTQKGC